MSLGTGTRLGPYEILEPLGAGGMGEVYRARDTKLGRDVALKFLPAAFAQGQERLARFQREAQVLASLNHPNIAAIYGLEQNALVMELVDGPTLAERIAQGAVPLEEAVFIARQIAEALETAHEKGIVHRDLKPANIKLTVDGKVKVLDFGLAAVAQASACDSADSANSPTITMAMTRAGVILGTAAYMAPEQAKGKAVDKRGDIWAFGVVLMEMLTSRQTYTGETAAETLASVMKDAPPLDRLPSETPATIRKLLERCLDKDPKRRLRDIGEARIVLEGNLSGTASPVVPLLKPQRRANTWPILAALVTLAALALALVHFRETPLESRTVKLSLLPPEKTSVFASAVSPDGRRVAFTAREASGKVSLWVRSLDALTAQLLPGTDGAANPFWSPDSRFIGFFSENKVKKIEASGGPTQTLCDAGLPRGASWNRDGVILFSRPGGLYRVSAAGGEANEGVYAASIDEPKKRRRPLGDRTNAEYSQGHLLFVRDGTMMAQPFDPARAELRGDPFPVVEKMGYRANINLGLYSVSENGVLTYQTGEEPARRA